MLVINATPPCCDDSKKSICGNTMLHPECSHCGFNPEENERRKDIRLTARPDGRLHKIIPKGENAMLQLRDAPWIREAETNGYPVGDGYIDDAEEAEEDDF